MKPIRIEAVRGRQILDSRGTPTVEAEILLDDGTAACASVPSGASTGRHEAVELRDGDRSAYQGRSVLKAVRSVNETLNSALKGRSAGEQAEIDDAIQRADGTENKAALGANATLAVSLACAKAAAAAHGLGLYRWLGGANAVTLPVPMLNILNGGAHADNNLDIQEFMILPFGAPSFCVALKMAAEIYACLRTALKARDLVTSVGDEGGFAPNLRDDTQAFELLLESIEAAGYRPGADVYLAIDAAASEWAFDRGYRLPKRGTVMTREELIDRYEKLTGLYPIVSIEDPLSEDDFEGFSALTTRIGRRVQIVGDDLFVTNPARLRQGIAGGSANAILIKPNQIGTLTETMQAVRLAHQNGYRTILSHRSGETEDTAIADIAVALNAGQIKTGAPCRTERVCKYNRLLKIEQQLGPASRYGHDFIPRKS